MSELFAPLGPWAFGALRPHAYNLIDVDYPWAFESYSEKGEAKGAGSKYRCYSPEECVRRFPINQLAEPNTLALVWMTWPLVDRQISAVQSLGFIYKTMAVWRKVFPSGKTTMGPGYRVRAMCEPVGIFTIGEPDQMPFPGVLDGIAWDEEQFPGIFDGVRREHSRKPEEWYDMVRRLTPRLTRRACVFTRETRAGFASFGDEATKFDEVAG